MTDKITIKTIQARTGVPVTGEFIIETLKVAPVEREKRSVFWSEAQYGEIIDKLVAHLQANKGNKAIAPKPEPKKKEETAAAPAAGGFNFGGAAAPTPAPAPSGDAFDFGAGAPSPAPAPAAGFNFGGEAAAPAPAPAAGGFNFG